MKQYTDSDKLFRSDMLRRYPGKHTKIYRDYAYDPDVGGAFHTAEEIDEAYEKNTGLVIIESFRAPGIDPAYVPAVLC